MADLQYQYREDANKLFAGKTNFGDYFGAMKPGTVFKQPELAATLERIAKSGADDFITAKPRACWWRKCSATTG